MKQVMQLRPTLFLLLACAAPLAHAEKPVAPEYIRGATIVSAEELVELAITTPKLVIIDSRKQDEYRQGHIEGAISLLDTETSEKSLAQIIPTKKTPVLFYCNGSRCLRSSNATTKALAWGYKSIYWFRGGWREWSDKRMPISR